MNSCDAKSPRLLTKMEHGRHRLITEIIIEEEETEDDTVVTTFTGSIQSRRSPQFLRFELEIVEFSLVIGHSGGRSSCESAARNGIAP